MIGDVRCFGGYPTSPPGKRIVRAIIATTIGSMVGHHGHYWWTGPPESPKGIPVDAVFRPRSFFPHRSIPTAGAGSINIPKFPTDTYVGLHGLWMHCEGPTMVPAGAGAALAPRNQSTQGGLLLHGFFSGLKIMKEPVQPT